MPRAAASTSANAAVAAAWSRDDRNRFTRSTWVRCSSGSIGNTSGSGSPSTVKRLTPTMTRSPSSIDFVYS